MQKVKLLLNNQRKLFHINMNNMGLEQGSNFKRRKKIREVEHCLLVHIFAISLMMAFIEGSGFAHFLHSIQHAICITSHCPPTKER